jgi:hypothetical protein
MKKAMIGCVLAIASTATYSGIAHGAGGGGTSICSGSGKPDGVVVLGDLSTYNNAGEFVTAEIAEFGPLPGVPGSGWNVQGVCNPNRFVP